MTMCLLLILLVVVWVSVWPSECDSLDFTDCFGEMVLFRCLGVFGYDTHYSFSIAYGYLRRIFHEGMLYELVAMLRVMIDITIIYFSVLSLCFKRV